MKYDNSSVRRQDRLLDEYGAYSLLTNGEYGIMSMVTPDGEPYGIPVSYVWDGVDTIYIHCAPEGKKIRCLRTDCIVSFCIVGNTGIVPHKFTTNYESIILSCRADIGLDVDERMRALTMIIDKYSPKFRDMGEHYAKRSFHRTEIIRLTVVSFSGKSKRVKA